MKKFYLLGIDKCGDKVYLQAPKFDCGWYWAFGYIEVFDNDKKSDLICHCHANNFLSLWNKYYAEEKQYPFISKPVFSEDDGWKLSELFKRFYLFKDLAELYRAGYCGITRIDNSLENLNLWARVNKDIIPNIIYEVLKILDDKITFQEITNLLPEEPFRNTFTLQDLKNELNAIIKDQEQARAQNQFKDLEEDHIKADNLLLKYIQNEEVSNLFHSIDKWYA